MIVRNELRLLSRFSLRSQLDMRDVSHIFTDSLTQARQWHNLILARLIKQTGSDVVVHICPWDDEDWKPYLKLQDQVSEIVLWVNESMKIDTTPRKNVKVVHFKASFASERFVIVSGSGIDRALVSWDQTTTIKDDTFLAVFISSPKLAKSLANTLSEKLTASET